MSDRALDRETLPVEERAAFAVWQAMLDGLPHGAVRADGWTVPEIVAHIAAWHRFSADRLERLAAGELLDPPDADRFNAGARAEAAGRGGDELRAEAEDARRAFLAAIDALPPGRSRGVTGSARSSSRRTALAMTRSTSPTSPERAPPNRACVAGSATIPRDPPSGPARGGGAFAWPPATRSAASLMALVR